MWSSALAAGVTQNVFDRTTPAELRRLVEARNRIEMARERAKDRRAGLVAAAIYNVNRSRKTDKIYQPDDFFRHQGERVNPEEAQRMLTAWARRHNEAVA